MTLEVAKGQAAIMDTALPGETSSYLSAGVRRGSLFYFPEGRCLVWRPEAGVHNLGYLSCLTLIGECFGRRAGRHECNTPTRLGLLIPACPSLPPTLGFVS